MPERTTGKNLRITFLQGWERVIPGYYLQPACHRDGGRVKAQDPGLTGSSRGSFSGLGRLIARLQACLEELEPEHQAALLQTLDSEEAADILDEMDPDNAADVLGDLAPHDAATLLDSMEQDEAVGIGRGQHLADSAWAPVDVCKGKLVQLLVSLRENRGQPGPTRYGASRQHHARVSSRPGRPPSKNAYGKAWKGLSGACP